MLRIDDQLRKLITSIEVISMLIIPNKFHIHCVPNCTIIVRGNLYSVVSPVTYPLIYSFYNTTNLYTFEKKILSELTYNYIIK